MLLLSIVVNIVRVLIRRNHGSVVNVLDVYPAKLGLSHPYESLTGCRKRRLNQARPVLSVSIVFLCVYCLLGILLC